MNGGVIEKSETKVEGLEAAGRLLSIPGIGVDGAKGAVRLWRRACRSRIQYIGRGLHNSVRGVAPREPGTENKRVWIEIDSE